VDEQIQFDHVLSALLEDMVGQILDLVETAPEATPYTFLKARILETHQLSDYEKFYMLVKIEPLGNCKPSQLLAAMMEFCPAGMEKTLPFYYYFTQRLPAALQKPDGSWRPCGDYLHLNLVMVPDSYPLPNMLDFTEKLAGCMIFNKVDLRKGYHQIPMNEDDIQKTAITTPFGLFEFLRMTFGLRNAGNTFQRRMDRILGGLDFVFVYLDDVIVASRSDTEHLHHLHLLFQRLQAAGLVINREKCVFGVAAVEFLGHHVSAAGTTPITSNVATRSQPQSRSSRG
jgi:hypothetical protein